MTAISTATMKYFHVHVTIALLVLSVIPTVIANCSIDIASEEVGAQPNAALGEAHFAAVAGAEDCDTVEISVGGKHFAFEKKSASTKGNGRTRHLSSSVQSHWTGLDAGGDILDYIINDSGFVYGSFWSLEEQGVWRFKRSKEGKQIAEFVKSSDFPEGSDVGYVDHSEHRDLAQIKAVPEDLELLQAGQVGAENKIQPQPVPVGGIRGTRISLPVLDLGIGRLTEDKLNADKPNRRQLDSGEVIIDVAVAWTSRAECRADDRQADCNPDQPSEENMRSLIDQTVSEANTAFSNSGTGVTLNLVHAYRTSYTEKSSSTFSTALNHFTNTGDKEMDDIHQKRIDHGADMAALIIENDGSSTCGIAWVPQTFASSQQIKNAMFSVTGYNCMAGGLTFAHELGHNMGCNHDKKTSQKCNDPAYNYGYREPSRLFRSVMSYDCWNGPIENAACNDKSNGGTCMRVPYFSSDTVLYNGMNIGDVSHDNTKQISAVKEMIAGVMPTVPTCSTNGECDDGDSCTNDTCDIEGRCRNDFDISRPECLPSSSLQTTFTPTHYSNGAAFKITAIQDIEIQSLKVHLLSGGTHTVQVLTKVEDGTWDDFEVVLEEQVSTSGLGDTVDLPEFPSSILVPAGTRIDIWVRCPTGGVLGTAASQLGGVYSSNGDLLIHEGFMSSTNTGNSLLSRIPVYMWNGSINYVISVSSLTSSAPTPSGVLSTTSAPSVSPTGSPTASPTTYPTQAPITAATNTDFSIETTFSATHFDEGALFKIHAKQDISITSLDIHLAEAATHEITIMTKVDDGSWSGFQFVTSQSVTTTDANFNHVALPALTTPISVAAGTSQWILVHSTTGKLLITASGNLDSVVAENSHLSIHQGYAVQNRYIYSTYTFNGIVHYRYDSIS